MRVAHLSAKSIFAALAACLTLVALSACVQPPNGVEPPRDDVEPESHVILIMGCPVGIYCSIQSEMHLTRKETPFTDTARGSDGELHVTCDLPRGRKARTFPSPGEEFESVKVIFAGPDTKAEDFKSAKVVKDFCRSS